MPEAQPTEHHRLLEDLVSPYSAKLRSYLHFKRIPYRRVRIDFEMYMQTIPRSCTRTGGSCRTPRRSSSGSNARRPTPSIRPRWPKIRGWR